MKKLLFVVLVCLLALPVVALAQEQPKLQLDLSQNFKVTDLKFQFLYPKGWVTTTGKGLYLAENQADLDALVAEQNPAGLTMRMFALPLAIEEIKKNKSSLDDIATELVKQAGLTEKERVDIPLMARRAVTVFAANENGRSGIISLWYHDTQVLVFVLGTPDYNTAVKLAYTWGYLLGSIAPLEFDKLEEKLELPTIQATLLHPKAWVSQLGSSQSPFNIIADNEADVKSLSGSGKSVEGRALSIIQAPASQVVNGLDEKATASDVLDGMSKSGLKDVKPSGYYLVNQQPGEGIRAVTSDGVFVHIIVTVKEGMATAYLLTAPDVEALAAFEPTGLMMLHNIRSTASK
jgi:hypothetical protein